MNKKNFVSALTSSLPNLIVIGILLSGWMVIHKLNNSVPLDEEVGAAPQEIVAQDVVVSLPDGKIDSGKFRSLPTEHQLIEHIHTIPGRLRYDETKHVAIKAPLDGVIKQILVSPGQQVKQGEVLAILKSPEIGSAKAEVLKKKKELEIARQILDRDREIAEDLAAMLSALDQGATVSSIDATTPGKSLGSYRQEILATLTRLQLANELLAKVEPLSRSGAVPGRTIRERQAERQMAETAYRTARDQSLFSANQSKLQSEAGLANAERQVKIAWQGLEALLGEKVEHEQLDLSGDEATSHLKILAPFSGSVEARSYANDERVSRGDSLIVLADTDSLYVEASIRENDWPAIQLKQGTSISVEIPALPNRVFDACVRYVGREVESETNSMPLIALIDNSEGLLRPGMFARVTIPMAQPDVHLSVKPESVVQHENQSFVFVDLGGGQFKKVNVATGQASNDWIEIQKGLTQGELVVTQGAFLLKSELLLQGEGD